MPSFFAACPGVNPASTRLCAADTVSRSSGGRPGLLPRFLAAAIPSRVHSEMSRRSKWAIVPKTWNTSSPVAEVVSMRSSRLTKWMSRVLRFSTVSSSSFTSFRLVVGHLHRKRPPSRWEPPTAIRPAAHRRRQCTSRCRKPRRLPHAAGHRSLPLCSQRREFLH